MKTTGIILVALGLTGMLLNACKEEAEEPTLSEKLAQEEASMAELANLIELQIGNDLENSQSPMSAPGLKSALLDEYPVISIINPSGAEWPQMVAVNYGDENHTIIVGVGDYSRQYTIRGQVIIEKSGMLLIPGTVWNVSFNGFYVNDINIDGTQTVVNKGINNQNHPELSWTSALKLTKPDGSWVERNVTKTLEMTAGISTPANVWDDEFLVSGTAVGDNSDGMMFNYVIENVLFKRSCPFPVSGTVTIVNSLSNYILNYGDGACDAIATVNNGNDYTQNITLGKKM